MSGQLLGKCRGKLISPRQMITTTALLGITLCSTATAEYYPQPTYNHNEIGYLQASTSNELSYLQANLPNEIGYLKASFPRPANHGHTNQQAHQPQVFTPPAVIPYVPFDNEQANSGNQRPQQPVFVPQTIQHYQPPAHNPQPTQQSHQQPRARTWQQTPAAPNPNHLSNTRQKVLQAARRQLGVRYRWGGNNPRQGFDCSGFTKHAMRSSNISIPRTAAQQSRASRTISRSQLRPGDMIFFKTSGRHINHVGIYLGNGRFIHAASGGAKVMTDDLRKAYWQKRLHKYGTFFS